MAPLPPNNSKRVRQRRRSLRNSLKTSTPVLLSLILILLSFASTANGFIIFESDHFRELADKGEIHVDSRPPPPRPERYLQRRQVGDDEMSTTSSETATAEPTTTTETSSTSETASVETTSSEPSSTSESATTTTATRPSVAVETTSLPSPFDTSLGNNFTSSGCPTFFNSFLSNTTFQSCVPISLLMQNSNSFFQIQRSDILLAQTLDTACNAPLAICSPLLLSLAAELIQPGNCGPDFTRENPLVTQAYAGLIAYEPVYRATCLRDQDTGAYCYANAITNSSNPSDFYPYYTALGLNMPPAARPSCTSCLQETMSIFASYAENAEQPLSRTYMACAQQVDSSCGADFATTSVLVGSVQNPNAAGDLRVSWRPLVLTAALALLVIVA